MEGNATDAAIKDFQGKKGNTVTSVSHLVYKINIKSGLYRIVNSLFFNKKGMWLQQNSREDTFKHVQGLGHLSDKLLLKKPLPDIQVKQDAPPSVIKIDSIFINAAVEQLQREGRPFDRKLIKPIQLSVSADNKDIVDAKIKDKQLILAYKPLQIGTAIITLKGKSGDQELSESFTVRVVPRGIPLVIVKPLGKFEVLEDSSPTTVDLNKHFTRRLSFEKGKNAPAGQKKENQVLKEALISYQLVSNSNPQLVVPRVDKNLVRLTYQPDHWGQATIRIKATMGTYQLEETLQINVLPVDDRPVIKNPIGQIVLDDDQNKTRKIDLQKVFYDVEVDQYHQRKHQEGKVKKIEKLTFFLLHNSHPKLFKVSLKKNLLTITKKAGQAGEAILKIKGESNGLVVEHKFKVACKKYIPIVAKPIQDIIVDEDSPSFKLDLSKVFAIDGKGYKRLKAEAEVNNTTIFDYNITQQTNQGLVKLNIHNNNLWFHLSLNQNGESKIAIKAIYQTIPVESVFKLTVKPVDDPPIVAKKIEKIEVEEDTEIKFDLSPVFTDPDNDNNQILLKTLSDHKKKFSTVRLAGNQLILVPKKDKNGSDLLKLEGKSNQQTVTTEIPLYIIPIDDPPVVTRKLDNIKSNTGSKPITVDISRLFTDVDNHPDKITVSSNSSDNDLAIVNVSDDQLIIEISDKNDGEAVIYVIGESNGKETQTSFNLSVEPASNFLLGYFSIGAQQVTGYTMSPMIAVGIGINLDSLGTGLSTELEVAGNISAHEKAESNELDSSTLGLYLSYNFLSFKNFYEDKALDFRTRIGYLSREDRVTTTSESLTKVEKTSTNELSYAFGITIPFFGTSGFFMEYTAVGSDMTRIGLGYRSTGREL